MIWEVDAKHFSLYEDGECIAEFYRASDSSDANAPSDKDAMEKLTLASVAPELLEECREHGIPNNPYGTFADALENFADEVKDTIHHHYATWLVAKARSLRAAIAKAEGRTHE